MLLAALLVLAAPPSPAATEQLRYTPATCSTDAEGKVYLRLNTGVAFGFPADALIYFRDGIDFEPPPAPNPADPEGCPGNPIVTPSAHLLFHFPRPAETLTEGFAPDIRLVLRIGGASVRLFGNDGYLRLQGGALRMFRTLQKNGMWCEFTPAGWDVCYGTNVVGAEPADRGGAIYVARKAIHPLRSGAPLTLECWPPDDLTGARKCSSQYEPLARVKLFFRFQDNDIPVDHFFALDRALTAWLEAARVPELDFEPPAHVLHRPEKDR